MLAAGATYGAAVALVMFKVGATGLLDTDAAGAGAAVLEVVKMTRLRSQVEHLHAGRATCLWCKTKASVRVKSSLQLLSIRDTTDIRYPYMRYGNRWLWRAALGSMGRLSIPSWMDVMVAPSGSRTETGLWVG